MVAKHTYTNEQLAADVKKYGSPKAAERATGISESTYRRRLSSASQIVTVAPLPQKKLTLQERLDAKRKASELLIAHKKAEKWREHKIKIDGPIGICWFGDPHIDDDGCNFKLLERDLKIARDAPGMLAANLGDTINNWVGKLQRIYAHQTATEDEALEMFIWFMEYLPWWLNIYGNHCDWPTPNRAMMKHVAEMSSLATQDWQAQMKLVFPNKREVKIWAAHDFPGHSQWNPLHGPMKRATTSQAADLYIAGDKHNWAMFHREDETTNKIYWSCRARGYKYVDTYAEHLGFGQQQHGASIVSIINPEGEGTKLMQCFADVEEAADYLKYLRRKYASK